MGARGDLGQGPRGEATGTLDDHRGRPPAGGLEREPVLRVAGGGPELASPLDGPVAAVPQIDQRVPRTRGAEPVDDTAELVEVTELDRPADRIRYGGPLRIPVHRPQGRTAPRGAGPPSATGEGPGPAGVPRVTRFGAPIARFEGDDRRSDEGEPYA